MAFVERVFSGVQPTGNLHLGNYLGAIVNFVKLQETHNCIYCVVDMHAITQRWTSGAARPNCARNTREVTAAFIAAGIDPKKHIVFNQSQVLEHAELAWIFNCVARIGWLNRMTQFKEKAGKDRENASVGLYDYPMLMAADILVYRATHVPVGDDQKQHLELSRDIAQKFNNDFAEFDPRATASATAVLSAAGAADHGPGDARDDPARRHQEDVEVGCVGQFAHQPDRRRRHHRAEDPQGEDRSGAAAVGGKGSRGPPRGRQSGRHLCRACPAAPRPTCSANSAAGSSRASRTRWSISASRSSSPIAAEMKRLVADPGHVDAILVDGADRARAIAAETMQATKDIVGFVSRRSVPAFAVIDAAQILPRDDCEQKQAFVAA